MVIRTGILSIPEWDEQAISQLRLLLRNVLPSAIVVEEKTAKSQRNWIEEILRQWSDEEELDLILTVGGTYPAPGPSTDETVPEATMAVLERLLPGLSEAMRAVAHEETELALLDRGVAGIRSRTLIVNLPAGAAAAHLFLSSIVGVVPKILAHLQGNSNAPRINDELEIVSEIEPDSDSDSDLEFDGDSDGETEAEPSESPNQKTESNPTKKGLDPAEFAEFLRRRKDS